VKEKILPPVDDALAKKIRRGKSGEVARGCPPRSGERVEIFAGKGGFAGKLSAPCLTAWNFDLPETAVAHETRNVVYDIVRENSQRGVGSRNNTRSRRKRFTPPRRATPKSV